MFKTLQRINSNPNFLLFYLHVAAIMAEFENVILRWWGECSTTVLLLPALWIPALFNQLFGQLSPLRWKEVENVQDISKNKFESQFFAILSPCGSNHGRIWKHYLAMMRWEFYHCASTAGSLNTSFIQSTFSKIITIKMKGSRECSVHFKD